MMFKNKGFLLKYFGELVYLQAPLIAESGLADHAFSARVGGCSVGKMTSLNMAFHVKDEQERVLENRRRFFDCFGLDFRQIIAAVQVHGAAVAEFSAKQRGQGALPRSAQRRCDALVTTEPGLILSAYAADCQLIYFCASDRPLVAIAHAGKQGALGRIGPKVIAYLEQQYRVKPERLLVATSPVICRCCYRVGSQDAEAFRQAGWSDQRYLEPVGEEQYKLDLGAINLAQLLTAGIIDDNIAVSGLCTSCNPDLFYSYRRDHGLTGRMIGFIALKKEGSGN